MDTSSTHALDAESMEYCHFSVTNLIFLYDVGMHKNEFIIAVLNGILTYVYVR